MKELSTLYDGAVELEFEPVEHVYTWNGEVIPNITSVLGVVKAEALERWKIKQAVEYIRDNWFNVIDQRLCDEAMVASERVVNKASEIGTEVHRIIEDYVNHCIDGNWPGDFTPTYNDNGNPDYLAMQKAGWKHFAFWAGGRDIEWIMSERKTFSMEHKYCGTVDALCRINGRLTVLDFKTSNRLYPKYLVQGAAYLKAINEEMPEYDPKQVVVLRIPKETEGDQCETISLYGKKKIDEAFKDFLACLRVHQSDLLLPPKWR